MRIAAVAAGLFCAGVVGAQSPSPAALLARGDSAWAVRDLRTAFVAYDALVRADSLAHPDALLRLGTLHGWAGRLRAAIACHALYVRTRPSDVEGRTSLGRSLAWSGRYAVAMAQYDTALMLAPGSREAPLGRATVRAWSGDLSGAITELDAWGRRFPGDAEGPVLRARFLGWQGRATSVRVLRDSLLGAGAALGGDVAEAWRWVEAEVRPVATVRITHGEDSEDNAVNLVEVGARLAAWGALRADVAVREKRVRLTSVPGSALRSTDAMLALGWQPLATRWTLRGEMGLHAPSAAGAAAAVIGGLRFSSPVARMGALAVSASRAPFDDIVNSASLGLMLDAADVEWSGRLRPSFGLDLAVGTGAVRGDGAPNARTSAAAQLRHAPRRGVTVGIGHREVAWDRSAPGVYFAPQRFALTEAMVRWETMRELGLVLSGEVGLGSQLVRLDATESRNAAPRVATRLGWRAAPSREVVLGFNWAASASAGTLDADDYRATALTLALRWGF